MDGWGMVLGCPFPSVAVRAAPTRPEGSDLPRTGLVYHDDPLAVWAWPLKTGEERVTLIRRYASRAEAAADWIID